MGLDEPLLRRAIYFRDLLRMAWFYVIDFSQGGSIAERRRDDAPAAV